MTVDVISLAVLFAVVAAISAAFMALFHLLGRGKEQPADDSATQGEPSAEISFDDNFEKNFLSVLLVAFLGIIVPFVCIWAVIFKGAIADGSGTSLAVIMLVFLCPLMLAYLFVRREA